MLTRQPWLADVFILSLKVGGHLVEPRGREPGDGPGAFRIGQHRNVLVHKFVTSGTIEEKIELMLAEKRQLADELIDGAARVTSRRTRSSSSSSGSSVRPTSPSP